VDEVVLFDPSEFSKAGMAWKPLRPELSVEDVAHEYMEFALRQTRLDPPSGVFPHLN
jgi:hypothetical protein